MKISVRSNTFSSRFSPPPNAGFSLIELMMVVAIIGIVSAVALPAYQDYAARAQASECASLARDLRTSIADALARGVPVGTSNSTAVGANVIGIAPDLSILGRNVEKVTAVVGSNPLPGVGVSPDLSTITCTMAASGPSNSVSPLISGATAVMEGSHGVGSSVWRWIGGTMSDRYRPKN